MGACENETERARVSSLYNRASMCWKIATICIMAHLSSIHADVDYMALLSETLRTRHRLGCTTYSSTSTVSASASITLRCPPGTTISVTLAHYTDGPTVPLDNHSRTDGMPDVVDIPHCPLPVIPGNEVFNLNCTNELKTKWREVAHDSWVRYSLLQKVVETCQKKRQCRVVTGLSKEENPCSVYTYIHRPRFIELAYKCRPYEFRSVVACDGERIALSCNPGSRVAIYSGVYGRTEYETFHCPQPSGVPEETCVAEGGLGGVMRACHGHRSCVLTVTPELFIHPTGGNPCKHANTKPYLHVVYTCVHRKVLAEEYEVPLLPDEDELPPELGILEEGFDKADFKAAFSPSPNLVGPPSGTGDPSHPPLIRTPLSEEEVGLSSAEEKNSEDEGMFYVWIGICCGVLVALGGVFSRVVFIHLQTHRQHHAAHVSQIKYQGDISAIEAELDLTSVTSEHKKRSVPRVVEDTVPYKNDSRFPLAPGSTAQRGIMETTLISKEDAIESPLRGGQSPFYPA